MYYHYWLSGKNRTYQFLSGERVYFVIWRRGFESYFWFLYFKFVMPIIVAIPTINIAKKIILTGI